MALGSQGSGLTDAHRKSIGDSMIADGATREAEARRLAAAITAERAAAREPAAYAFGPTLIQRGPPRVIDPFGTVAVVDPFADDASAPTRSSKRAARTSARTESQRAMPVSATSDSGRVAPIEPYRGGASAVPIPTDQRGRTELSPKQQAIVDAFWDERARWTSRDEFGREHVTARRIGGDLPSSGELRTRDENARQQLDEEIAQDVARRAAAAPRRREYF